MTRNLNLIQRILEKLFIRQWTIGFFRGNIKDIIRAKSFDPDIKWLPIEPFKRFFADPFFLPKRNGYYCVIAEEFSINEAYGKISLMTIDETLQLVSNRVLLDTKNHQSYPFIFEEDNKIYVFPESGISGDLSCYEYNPEQQSLNFFGIIMNLPIVDPTILKYNNKYWLFATLRGEDSHSKLYIYFSDNLMGPYREHPLNPVKNTLKSSRPAGNFIEVDGILYRPSQNCENRYGESITINKINVLDEFNFSAEPYMTVSINQANKHNKRIHSIHTINEYEDIIVVDSQKRIFYPFGKLRHWLTKSLRKSEKFKSIILMSLTTEVFSYSFSF